MFCQPYDIVFFLIYSPSAPHLLYYSHIPAAIIALLLSGFIFYHNRKLLEAKILGVIAVLFSAWAVMDMFIWVITNSAVISFLWSLWYSFFCLLFALSFYFLYVYIKQKDAPFWPKLIGIALLFVPLVITVLGKDFESFDMTACNATATPLILIVTYGVSSLYFLAMLVFSIKEIFRSRAETRKKAIFASTGILLFLISFSVASYISDISSLFKSSADTFAIEQYGYFGMTIFIGLLTYSIVKYRAFNVKLIAAQALVVSLIILVGSQFFFIQNPVNKILNGITFTLTLGFGLLLVKSVKKEVQARELIQIQKDQLEKANARLRELDKQKTEFISFASHQLRSPLTAIKGHASLILEGDLGPITDQLKGAVETIYASVKTQISVVEDYLNVSRMELGTMKYNMVDMDFKDLLKEVMNEQKTNIEAKGLKHSIELDESQSFKIKADPDKFKQVVMNTIDNSIKYTPQGSISVSLTKDEVNKAVRLKISDTGVGINPEVMPKLFQKFSRAPHASEANIHGTGLGLFIAKEIMNAHGGRVWAESEGEGKGSQFYIELPEAR